jgi:uncharacterized protein
MRINLSDLLKKVGNVQELEFSKSFDFKPDIDLVKEVNFKGRFLNSGHGVILEGALRTKILTFCSRCLKEINQEIKINLRETFSKEKLVENESFRIDSQNYIEPDELIRQNILVNLPFQPLCSKKCPGIELKKEKKKIDPRFEELRKLKKS